MHEVTELIPPAAALAGTVGGWLMARGALVVHRRHGGRQDHPPVNAAGSHGTSFAPSGDDAGTPGRGGRP